MTIDNKEYGQSANLCMCNKCGSILIDENPQTNAPMFAVREDAKEMIQLPDGDFYYWACPICSTDDYLTDIENETAISKVEGK